jgi:hypothetical protein
MLWQGNAYLFFMLIIHEYYSPFPLKRFKACSQQLPERWSEVAEQIERVNGDIEQQQAELADLGPEVHLRYGPLGYLFQLFSFVYPHH